MFGSKRNEHRPHCIRSRCSSLNSHPVSAARDQPGLRCGLSVRREILDDEMARNHTDRILLQCDNCCDHDGDYVMVLNETAYNAR